MVLEGICIEVKMTISGNPQTFQDGAAKNVTQARGHLDTFNAARKRMTQHPLGSPLWLIALCYIYLSFSFGLNAVILNPNDVAGAGGSSAFAISWVIMHSIVLVTFFALMIQDGPRADSPFRMVLFSFTVFYFAISCLWAPKPESSAPYSIMLAANAVFSYMVATRLAPDRFFIIVRNVLIGMIVLGIFSWLLGYQKVLYIDYHDRYNLLGMTPLRGLFPHKIVAALFANIAIALILATMRGFARWCFVSICIIFILLTGSSTGILLLVLTFIGFPALSILRGTRVPAYLVMTALLPFALGIIVLLTGYFDQILELLGRDSSLTGRTDLWQWGINSWLERPLFGWGYKGYFDSEEAFGLREIDRFKNYDVPHFHQSFIQIGVDLGIPGLLLIALNIFIAMAGCYKRSAYFGEKISTGALVVLLVSLVGSTSMFLFYNYNHPVTVILLYLMFYFTRRTRRGRRVMCHEQSRSPLPHAN